MPDLLKDELTVNELLHLIDEKTKSSPDHSIKMEFANLGQVSMQTLNAIGYSKEKGLIEIMMCSDEMIKIKLTQKGRVHMV